MVVRYLNENILSAERTKFLGIHIDSNLKWSTHIDAICKKLSGSYFALSRVRNSLPLRSILNIYYSLVYSHLSYNILLWGNSSEISRVFVLQKRILRMIFNIEPRSSCRPVFIENGLLTVASIFILKCLVYTKENENKFTKLSCFHSYGTRNERLLCIPKHNTSRFEFSPMYQCIKIFNHLPNSLRSLKLNEFKKAIKIILVSKCFYSVAEYFSDFCE